MIASGAVRFEDYHASVPGLSTTQLAPGYNQITVRGVTTGINQLSATVGTYFGETPTNSSTSTALGNRLTPDPDMLDVARIEVLRGPQGTLYGANALGGVIRYVLVQPDLNDASGTVQAGISAVEHGDTGYLYRGAMNLPLVADELALRASAFSTSDPGYVDNIGRGVDDVNETVNRGGRVALLWQPAESFSATLASLYQRGSSSNTSWARSIHASAPSLPMAAQRSWRRMCPRQRR